MKLFDLHADLGYAVWQKHEAGYTDILSSFYTDALRKGGILLMVLGVAVCAAGRFLRGD